MKHCTICKSKYDDSVSFCPTDGEVLDDDPSSIVGTVLDGQYNIESLLGKGGMGAVYLARHILLGDRVAIKILPPEVRNNAEWLRRFRREGQAARRFRHANAVTVYDLRTASDGIIYMVMEYVEGHTLDAELKRRGRFTAAETFEILEPIMSVLNTAHAMGVVHRDLKPENIMIGKATTGGEPQVKLLDLGIAKMSEVAGVESSGTTELTMAGQVLGTPYYMSPEQWGELSRDGKPEIDGRTDIYSLGLVAYQMICGERPYAALTLHELRREHISVDPTPLAEKIPEVSRAFSDAIGRAISKDRGDRPATAGELAAELRAGLGDAAGQDSVFRSFPDTSGAESSNAHTQGTPGLSTKSDVNAATILTIDALPTSAPNPPAPVRPPIAERPAAPQPPAAAAGVDLGSSVTVLQKPKLKPTPEPQKSRGKPLVFVGVAVLLLILVVGGVGGFFAIKWLKAKPGDGTSGTSGPETIVTTREFGRYWFQVDTKNKAQAIRAGDPVALVSGQDFKFHFLPLRDGYLYVIGPGANNAPTAFLTTRPNADSGLKTNAVRSGQDFAFPADSAADYHWVTLDAKPGTETYTIIFSPNPLSTPAFLNSQATGKPLSETEQAELNEFLAKYKANSPVTEVNNSDATAPFVTVKVPQSDSRDSGAPIVFAVRIQHK